MERLRNFSYSKIFKIFHVVGVCVRRAHLKLVECVECLYPRDR